MSIKIVTDSTAIFSEEIKNQYDIRIVPLSITIDGETYKDGVDISKEEFFKKMIASKNLPITSQPSIGDFTDVYNEFPNDEILSIHISGGLSGTINAASQAAEISKSKVTVFDSEKINQTLAYQVIQAAKMAQDGAAMNEITQKLEEMKTKSKIFLSVTNLENLIAGGRIGKVQGFIGGVLNIKVGLEFKDNKVETIVRGRGIKTITKFQEDIIDEMKKKESIQKIGISYVDWVDEANAMAKRLANDFPNSEITVFQTTPVVATHTSTGVLAIEYLEG